MKTILQILRGLTLGLPAALRALHKWLCSLIRREVRAGSQQCDTLNSPVVRIPDPLIYDQYYLMSLGLPVTWQNPDISLWLDGALVAPDGITANTTYQVVARIWNNSTDAPIAGLQVAYSYLSFGVGTLSHPIGQTQVNLGVKGGPDQPAFASLPWTTPVVPGHYCIQVKLEPASDANWNNNLGQDNTQVVSAHSPAVASFELRNDTDERQTYEFRVNAFQLSALPPCPPPQAAANEPAQNRLPSRLATLATQPAGQPSPLPSGWSVTMLPARPVLAASEEIPVQVTIEPPATFSGTQVVNIHAFRTGIDRAGAGAVLAGGMTFKVSSAAI